MQPITPTLASILAANSRQAIVEILVQGPNPANSLQAGTQLLLDGVENITLTRNEEPTADTIDFGIANADGRYSPIRAANPGIPNTATASYPDALNVGNVDWKALAFIGLANRDTAVLETSLLPQGTFLLETAQGTVQYNKNTQTSHGYDISKEFAFRVSAYLPHTLFGNQSDIRYDPNYNLKNPSADLKTYICDAKRFMTAVTDNAYMGADFTAVFGMTGGGINVYVGTPGTPATTPVSPSTYTWDAVNGIVTFTTAQASNAVVSIDGVPQAMAPELMLSHLFSDYGHYDSSYFDFDTSNILLPNYNGSSDTVWSIAQNIAAMTAPRAVSWRLRIDEYGYIRFYEDKYATTPTETLVDERDFLTLRYTKTSDRIVNISRAQASANNKQPLTSISYDVDSINEHGQKDYLSIDSTLLLACRGLPPLYAISFMNSVTAAQIVGNADPVVELNVDVVPNPARQVGDKVTVIEQELGLSGPYIIKGCNLAVKEGRPSQSLRLRQALLYANYNMGIPSAVSNSPAPGSVGDTSSNINASVVGRTNIVSSVTIGGTTCISNGAVVRDSNGKPIIPSLSGSSWTIAFKLDPTQNYDTAFYQMMYLEVPNSLSSSDLMVTRFANWVSNDGLIIPAATVTAGYTSTATHTTGTVTGSGEWCFPYSSLVFPAMTNGLSGSYGNQMTTLTYKAATGLTGSIGYGYGSYYTGSYAYYPQNKINYGYYLIVAFNASGATSILRVPFTLNL